MFRKAISAVLVMGLSGGTFAASANPQADMSKMSSPEGMERCYGIAKAGSNDCGTATHSCSGAAKKDGDKKEWIFMPAGLCDRIVGGSTKPPQKK